MTSSQEPIARRSSPRRCGYRLLWLAVDGLMSPLRATERCVPFDDHWFLVERVGIEQRTVDRTERAEVDVHGPTPTFARTDGVNCGWPQRENLARDDVGGATAKDGSAVAVKVTL